MVTMRVIWMQNKTVLGIVCFHWSFLSLHCSDPIQSFPALNDVIMETVCSGGWGKWFIITNECCPASWHSLQVSGGFPVPLLIFHTTKRHRLDGTWADSTWRLASVLPAEWTADQKVLLRRISSAHADKTNPALLPSQFLTLKPENTVI